MNAQHPTSPWWDPDPPTPAVMTPLTTVKSLMSSPLFTIPPEAELWQARASMTMHHVHHLLVEDRGRLVGIVSDRDIAYHVSPYASRAEEGLLHRRVMQVASFQMATIRWNARVEEAAALLLEEDVSALPVLDERSEIIGIVTSRDLLRGLLSCVVPPAA